MSSARLLFNFSFSDKHAGIVGLMLGMILLFNHIDYLAHNNIDFFNFFDPMSNRIRYAQYSAMFAFFILSFSTATLIFRKIGIVSLALLLMVYFYKFFTDPDQVYIDKHFSNNFGVMQIFVQLLMAFAVSLNLLIRALEFMFGLFGRAGE